ncbi:glycosyltransferase family 2 protein [Enterococcus dongliensis]|uniref:Glycosyltransferase family 2 protein n=1 Tax=Enterococcus dongliensis TaxID=2559925 RepID=A0AAW8TFA3_9ENTE|nr:glycosyltransferase family 2 protein [Enterococcus dongliensis]MDT2596764.1 glycosyltransferase family 2 protein [Enterococcus dongliensis]MDT2604156.1 glycosyltransferase family 2 protein [Enterococcus dongliensis]MDT2635107.1 glycosyltransferase family 2 protein [Enterococcus dongliensis]MDT2636546.1 glycosyltransferase family 2 protein [Enterococcus dongliensis]MDT2642202.1 glycosyltransferase family 2 protein [Enterococcus dongliensis]
MIALLQMSNQVLDTSFFILFLLLITYPVIGGFAWFIGNLCYSFLFKHRQKEWNEIPEEIEPFITIMVPAHNEEIVIEHTIDYLMTKINYEHYEVLVTDDGSTDSTPEILTSLQKKYPKLRVIRIEKNKGKAHAFNIGLGFAKGGLILSNDADTVPEPDSLNRYINYFLRPDSTNISAVTANMDVQNRSKLIAKSQTVEFSSIVGIIKRTQIGVLGSIYAYSGANTLYRKNALIDVGLFRQDRATEDISIAWDHQMDGWLSLFAPQIMFFMEVPESLTMLYRQRKRWAKGGTEVWLTNFRKVLLHPFRNIGRTVMFIDQSLSIIWSFFFWISSILFLWQLLAAGFSKNPEDIFHILTLSFLFICFEIISSMFQLIASLIVDDQGKKIKYLFFAPLYMLFYWIMNALTIVTTFIPAVKTIMGLGSGTWKSPERKGTANTTSDSEKKND